MKFTKQQLTEIKIQYKNLTGPQLFEHLKINHQLDCSFSSFRTALYNLGLKKCNMLRWTAAEKQFLLDNYQTMGNKELAEKLSKPEKPFTLKNVQKQMRLLSLKRTAEQLVKIKDQHKANGVYKNASARIKAKGTRYYPEGHIKVMVSHKRPAMVIKINGIFVHYLRYRYIQLHGEPPKGWKVYPKDYNFRNIADDNIVAKPATGNKTEEREKYQKFYKEYFAEQQAQKPKVIKLEKAPVPQELSSNMVTVKIGKLTIKVKPGTNIAALTARYNQQQANRF